MLYEFQQGYWNHFRKVYFMKTVLNLIKSQTKFIWKIAAISIVPLLFSFSCTQIILSAESPSRAHEGPIPPITNGFGTWGSFTMATPESFQIQSQGYTNTVTIYYPEGQTEPAPTIFFATGWNVSCDDYDQLFHFLVSKGYVAVCDDYGEDSGVIGAQLNDSFSEAVTRYPGRIDTSKIGLCGHSSGAGLLSSLSYDFVRTKGWGGPDGENLFIFSSAPWFDFDITDFMLSDFPSGIKLILQTYEDDSTTDLRIYIDQFESIPVPDTEKDYITLRSVNVSGYDYEATHSTLATGDGYGVFNALDDYGVFRLIDALAVYTFTGDAAAKNVALGDGSTDQIEMNLLGDLISTDDPRPVPGETYDYPCDDPGNPRQSHCGDYDSELPASILVSPVKYTFISTSNPEFIWEQSPTATDYFIQIRPLLPDGQPDLTTSYGENVTSACCPGSNQNCSYTLPTNLPDDSYVWWILPGNDTLNGVWSRPGYFQVNTSPPAIPTLGILGICILSLLVSFIFIRK